MGVSIVVLNELSTHLNSTELEIAVPLYNVLQARTRNMRGNLRGDVVQELKIYVSSALLFVDDRLERMADPQEVVDEVAVVARVFTLIGKELCPGSDMHPAMYSAARKAHMRLFHSNH
jgi:hypothetical protein